MIRTQTHKLIYYPVGNHFQLFDLIADPNESIDIARESGQAQTLAHMKSLLRAELYGGDEDWASGEEFVGKPNRVYEWMPHRSLNSQRGDGWPPSPAVDIPQIEWTLERK